MSMKRKVLCWGWETITRMHDVDGVPTPMMFRRYYALLSRGFVYRWNTVISVLEEERLSNFHSKLLRADELDSLHWTQYCSHMHSNWFFADGGTHITEYGRKHLTTNAEFIKQFRRRPYPSKYDETFGTRS